MFSGATILGDGAVALILDVAQLVEYGQSRSDEFREAG
jgi:two-component system chemotaxis sensor kinase CheA